MKKIKFILCWLLFVLPFHAISQITDFNFLYYNKEQGLPDNRIYDFQEDLKGRMWITTQTGVACFDGKVFKNYSHPFFDSVASENYGIHLLTIDDCGRIWEATSRQLFYFDEKMDKFIEYDLSGVEPEANKGTWENKIYLQDWKDNRSIWFRKGIGLYAINCDEMICRFKMKIPLQYRSAWGVLGKDLEGNIAVGGIGSAAITFFRLDGSNYTTSNPLPIPVIKITDTADLRLGPGYVMFISFFQQPGSNQIWVGGEYLMSYEKNTGHWEKWSVGSTGVGDFAGITTIPALTGDSILWMFGHYNTVITCFNTRQKKFVTSFQTEQFDKAGLRCGLLHIMYVDSKSNIWLGGNTGVTVILSSREQFEKYHVICPKGTIRGQISNKNNPAPYSGGTWKMPDGSLAEWVADGDILYYIALSNHSKAYFEGRRIGDGIAGQCKIINVQTGQRTVKQLKYLKNEQGEWLESNTKDQIDGIGHALIYWPETNDKIMIPHGDKFEIEKDLSGSWYGGGILAYYFQDGDSVVLIHPTHFFHGKRIEPDRLVGLQVRWWGGCRTEMWTNDIIISTDSIWASFKALDNNCDLKKGQTGNIGNKRARWFEGKDSIFIHTFRIFDKIQSTNPGNYRQEKYLLDYTQNFISFEFDCANPAYPLLWYKLEGFDHDWFQTRTTKSANYTNLDGGDYTFMVKATAEDGSDMGQSTSFKLHVSSPYYRTWWFYSLCLLSIGAIFYFIFRNRELQRLRQEQLRLRIARDLHDEVGSTLSSISILSQASLQGLEQDINKARFSNIGDKSRVALDSISDIVWSINPENDSMEKIFSRMSAYASDMLEHGGTTLSFHIDEKLETYKLPMEKRKDFYLLFKEAINNIAKHAQAKSVAVSLSKDKNALILNIKDDGIGFEKKGENELNHSFGGNGLKNMQSRAKAIGATLKINSISGTGTEIQLVLPAF